MSVPNSIRRRSDDDLEEVRSEQQKVGFEFGRNHSSDEVVSQQACPLLHLQQV